MDECQPLAEGLRGAGVRIVGVETLAQLIVDSVAELGLAGASMNTTSITRPTLNLLVLLCPSP